MFNVLALFEPSEFETHVVHVSIEEPADLDSLNRIYSESQSALEDWTATVRRICRQCSEGRPHEHHDRELAEEPPAERRLGIAAHPTDDVRQLLDRWQAETKGKVLSIESFPF